MHSPTIDHLKIVHCVLRYLKGSVGRGIIMRNNGHTHISSYTDAYWAGNSLDRKSTIGFYTFVGGNLVNWKSKEQSVVACSSSEAEYRAMASIVCELILHRILYSMNEPNTSRLIVTAFEIKFIPR
ncbi:hypothetical protein ACFX2C_017581 [Malus domestica]